MRGVKEGSRVEGLGSREENSLTSARGRGPEPQSALDPSPSTPSPSPDLTAITTWLFDLDDTLYPHGHGFMKAIERRIGEFVVRTTGLPFADAFALQKRYLAEHGTALGGLVAHHGVDPHVFVADVHDVPLDQLEPEPELRAAIARLPGRRLVFTNGSAWHAERVLRRLALDDLFEDVFHAEAADFKAKPHPDAFAGLIARHAIDPRVTAFFDDRERNLSPGAELGMTTVLVGPDALSSRAPFVHHRTSALASFLNAARVSGASLSP